MGILSQQLGISERATTNDIDVNPEARSLTAPSGFYADGGKYPDNRSVWDHNSLVEGADNPENKGDLITAAIEAGQRKATKTEHKSGKSDDGEVVYYGWRKRKSKVVWDAAEAIYEETYFTDGIRPSSTAGQLG